MEDQDDAIYAPYLFLPLVLILVAGVIWAVVALVPHREAVPPVVAEETGAAAPPPSGQPSPADEVSGVSPPETTGTIATVPPGLADSDDRRAVVEVAEAAPSDVVGGPIAPDKKMPAGDTPAEAASDRQDAAPDAWQHGGVTVRTSVFGFESSGEVGRVTRRGMIAPVDQRYLFISTTLSWTGKEPAYVSIISEEGDDGAEATVQLKSGEAVFNPIGRLISPPNPLRPFDTEPVMVDSGGEARLRLAFLTPENLDSVFLLVEGKQREQVKLPPPERLVPDRLLGFWRKSEEAILRFRYGDPLLDALARQRVRLLHIRRPSTGSTELYIQAAGIGSTSLVMVPNAFTGTLTLKRGGHLVPARLRSIDGGSTLVLYAGDKDAAFLFDRVD